MRDSTTSLDWLIDFRCINYMFFNKDYFDNYRVYNVGVIIANNITMVIIGRGTIEIK